MFPCRRTEPPFFRSNRRRFFPELSMDEKESSSDNALRAAAFLSVVASVKKSNSAENQPFSSSSSSKVVDPEKHVADCHELISLFDKDLNSGEWYFLWKLDHVSSSTNFLPDIFWKRLKQFFPYSSINEDLDLAFLDCINEIDINGSCAID
jgi:hypothetical protein